MASSPNTNAIDARGKHAAVISDAHATKEKEGAGNLMGARLLFAYCFACQIFSTYRAHEIYQDYENWATLSRKDKVSMAWAVISTPVVAVFTVAYVILEYRRRQGMEGRKKA